MTALRSPPQRMALIRDAETVAMVAALEAKLALVTNAVKVGMAPDIRAALETELAKIDGTEPEAKA